jgi:WD40 repeat protein
MRIGSLAGKLPLLSMFNPPISHILCIRRYTPTLTVSLLSSKDALINVYSRSTLTLHAVLQGHEGPVNAIGLEGGRVVSASGDGRMMLWDAASGRCERVFEGHERGLACIEFKVCFFFCLIFPIFHFLPQHVVVVGHRSLVISYIFY